MKITKSVAVAVGLALAGASGNVMWTNYSQATKTTAAASSLMDHHERNGKVESLPKGHLLPEVERSGKNIMMIATPSAELMDQLNANLNGLEKDNFPIFDALEAGTNVHLVVPYDEKEDYAELVTSKYPNIQFSFYEAPMSIDHGAYAQDRFYFTGQRDAEGRFEIVSSNSDFISKKDIYYGSEPWFTTQALADGVAETLTDDLVAKDYPDVFQRKLVDPYLIGGDMTPIRLPDGRSAIVMGRDALAKSVMALRIRSGEPLQHVHGRVSHTQMRGYIDRIKRELKSSLGTDEVIILGEKEVFDDDPGFVYLTRIRDVRLFHSDMVVKAVETPKGENVAFVTNEDSGKDGKILESTREEFSELGFNIVDLPVGKVGTLNYANSVVYTPEEGRKVVLLPQYGIPEDVEARRIFEEHGFEVRTVDYSHLADIDEETLAQMGSVHCTTVVMD